MMPEDMMIFDEDKCQICGCTDDNACEGGCYWVAEHLCSNCLDKVLEENNQQKELLDKIYQYCEEELERLENFYADDDVNETLQIELRKIKLLCQKEEGK